LFHSRISLANAKTLEGIYAGERQSLAQARISGTQVRRPTPVPSDDEEEMIRTMIYDFI
jgi:hypothetical protein